MIIHRFDLIGTLSWKSCGHAETLAAFETTRGKPFMMVSD